MSRSKTFGIPAQLKKKLNLICKKKKGLAICQKKKPNKNKLRRRETRLTTSHHFTTSSFKNFSSHRQASQ
jgi:hypothetical protein